MAYTEQETSVSLVAGADLTAHQFKFVSVDANGDVVLTAADAKAQGVLLNAPGVGEAATVAIGGIVKVKASGAITAGGDVSAAVDGTAGPAGVGVVLGTALETGANGRIISILLGR